MVMVKIIWNDDIKLDGENIQVDDDIKLDGGNSHIDADKNYIDKWWWWKIIRCSSGANSHDNI